jgi:hypothetical protein
MLDENEMKDLAEIRDLLNTYQENSKNSQGLRALIRLREIRAGSLINNIIENQEYKPDADEKEDARKYRQILSITMRDCQPRG